MEQRGICTLLVIILDCVKYILMMNPVVFVRDILNSHKQGCPDTSEMLILVEKDKAHSTSTG